MDFFQPIKFQETPVHRKGTRLNLYFNMYGQHGGRHKQVKLELASIKPPRAQVYQIQASNYFKATEVYALNTMDDIG